MADTQPAISPARSGLSAAFTALPALVQLIALAAHTPAFAYIKSRDHRRPASVNTEQEHRFARIAHGLEPDLARATRDLPRTGPPPRPGLSTVILTGLGLAALLLGPVEPTTPWLFAIALLAALTYLTQLTRLAIHEWITGPTDAESGDRTDG